MGKQWKKAGKAENSVKKGLVITKIAREIQVAAKLGGADPAMNSRLRLAIDLAKKNSVPNDTVERAIKKGTGQLEGGIVEEVTYEGYGPHGVGIIVECQTDNRHRTAPEIRNIFKKADGNMGESGSVMWMFKRVCLVEAARDGKFDPEEEAIEAGADEVEKSDDGYSFWGSVEGLDQLRTNLTSRGWKVLVAELSYLPQNFTDLTEEQLKDVQECLEELDDNDDSHRVYVTLKS